MTSGADLAFHGVAHAYGAAAVLHDISLRAEAGRILCLLGPSGGGKSTLLRLAAGLEPMQQGRITLGDDLLADPGHQPPPEQRPVGLVFQDHVLFPHLNVSRNVAFGLGKLKRAERRRRIAAQLEAVGLSGFDRRYPHTLSGGQQQRVALARALAPEPAVMLLDEPFASVDATLRRELRQRTRQALRQNATTAIVVTHDPEEAMELADAIAVMDRGCIVQSGTPETLWHEPATPEVALLFGQAQPLPAAITGGRAFTAFGELPTDATDGDGQVIVRPDAARLTNDGMSNAVVIDSRCAGHDSLLQVRALANADELRLRVPRPGPAEGTEVVVALDAERCFVFPSTKPDAE